MAIPKLTQEERARALAKAQAMRSARTRLRRRLKAKDINLQEVLRNKDDEVIGKMRVKYLLESMPQVGRITALKIMEELNIDEARRVQGLGKNQEANLLARFAAKYDRGQK